MNYRWTTFVLLATCFVVDHAAITKREVSDSAIEPLQSPYHSSQPGIQVQSGSVAYLVPDSKLGYASAIQDLIIKEGFLEKIKFTVSALLKSTVQSLSKIAIVALPVVVTGVTLAAVVFLAGFFLCEFTSFCFLPSISLTSFSNDQLEETMRAYIAPDKLTALSNFVINSIEKYSKKYKKNKTL